MSLEFVLLGLLREPAAGYDIKRQFDQGARYYWSAELSQIYPTLAKMQRRGWLASRREISTQGPARRIYRRTARGTRAFHHWLRGEPIVGVERFAYIAQLISLGELHDLDATTAFLGQLRGRLEFILNVLRSALEATVPQNESDPAVQLDDESFHGWLALRLGVASLTARVGWCDDALRLLAHRRVLLSQETGHV
jgi:DNA-binding PadR family transcriptional regulator